MDEELRQLKRTTAQMEKAAAHLERLRIAEYVESLQRPGRLILTNFIAGLARGLGIAIGATVIFALVIEFLRRIVILNIPGLGGFIVDIIQAVESQHRTFY